MRNRNLSIAYLIILLFILNPLLSAGEFTETIYQIYIEGRIQDWEPFLDAMAGEYTKTGGDDLLLELLTLEYGYIGFLVEEEKIKQSKKYLDTAMDHAELLSESSEFAAAAFALKGALFGYQININPGRAMFLGPKSQKNIDKAMELDPDSYFGWIESANSTRDKPAFVGGSPEEALEMFEKGIELLEEAGAARQNWYYLNAVVSLARTCRMTENENKAFEYYSKFLSIAPDCSWVRNEM